MVLPLGATPDFGRFYGSRGSTWIVMEAALAKNLPRRSRDTTGSPTDGFQIFL